MAMPRALVSSAAVWLESIDQPSTRREGVEDYRAIDLAFVGAVLGNVVDPQTIRSLAGEHGLDQIGGRRGLVAGPGPPAPRQSLDHGLASSGARPGYDRPTAPDLGGARRAPSGHRRCPVRRCARRGSGRRARHGELRVMRAVVSAISSNPTQPPRAAGTLFAWAVVLRPWWPWPRTVFWVVQLPQQLSDPFSGSPSVSNSRTRLLASLSSDSSARLSPGRARYRSVPGALLTAAGRTLASSSARGAWPYL